MTRFLFGLLGAAFAAGLASRAGADIVLDWNSTIYHVIQQDGLIRDPNQANPGWSSRAIAMMNGAIYDTFQAANRTHRPYLVDTQALPDTSLDAAIHQAAHDVLIHAYGGIPDAVTDAIDDAYNARMALVAGGTARTNGIQLGQEIAAAYLLDRSTDHANVMVPYMPGTEPGQWRPQPGQSAWGPGWGMVRPFSITSTQPFVDALPPIPAMTSDAYTDAFNQVKAYGELDSSVRTLQQEEIAMFWAYDRAGMGPPPALWVRNLIDVAGATPNTPAENARMFASASVAIADAAIAAWDAKYEYNFWRPIAAIREADTDENPNTDVDDAWQPLGAPGDRPGDSDDDFTPPFPAWTSGHATMGGALFKSLELFFGTNNFDEIDGIVGNDPTYRLTSQEAGSGGERFYSTFTQTGPLDVGTENSPEGENGTSRIYLGIHWIFDQRDGITLGNNIAEYVAAHGFQAVPEPSGLTMGLTVALVACGVRIVRRQKFATSRP